MATKRTTVAVSLACACALAPSVARAQPASSRQWYGYETLAIDGAAAAMLGGGVHLVDRAARDDDEALFPVALAALGGLAYLFGGPTVHWARGRSGVGFADLGARVALPLAGLGTGALVWGIAGKDNGTAALVGTIVGGCLAVAFDAAVLAFDPTLFHDADATSAPLRTRALTLGASF